MSVVRLVLDRAERANALDADTVERLHAELDRADAADAADEAAEVVVVEARGRAFCGGLDLSTLDAESDATLLLRLVRVQLLLERLQSSPLLTVALVEGAAVGAGADLALACSVRLALPHASLRMPGPGFGAVLGTARLAAESSPSYAAELATTRRRVDADEAAARGLWRVLPDRAALDAEVDRLAAAHASLPPGTGARLRAAAAPAAPSDALADLVRSLVSTPGLRDRVTAYLKENP